LTSDIFYKLDVSYVKV